MLLIKETPLEFHQKLCIINYQLCIKKRGVSLLVITRKKGESILIGDDIEITVSKVEDGSVKLAINAPKDKTILRKELFEEVKNENKEATKVDIELLKMLGKK